MSSTTLQEFQLYTRAYTRTIFQISSRIVVIVFIILFFLSLKGIAPKPAPARNTTLVEHPRLAVDLPGPLPTQISLPTATPVKALMVTLTSLPETHLPSKAPASLPTATKTPEPARLTQSTSTTHTSPHATQKPTLAPDAWKSFPVIPTLSSRALAIYQRGLVMGNHPQAFTKIGDGEISGVWFLTDFDLGKTYYSLGAHTNLQTVIEYFTGSFGRKSLAARRGFNTSRVLDPAQADPLLCNSGETPLDCEIRLYHPSFALISMGTNQVWTPALYELELRQIIDTLIKNGIVPVLSTKGDNLEGDYRINATIASLAYEYDLPLWNFWLAIQSLPDQGMQGDREHLTYARNNFSDPYTMTQAWPVRNLTALQVLSAIMDSATSHLYVDNRFNLDATPVSKFIPPTRDANRRTPPILMLHPKTIAFDPVSFLQDMIQILQEREMVVITYQDISANPDITAGRQGELFIITIDDISLQAPIDPSTQEMIDLLLDAGFPAVLGVVTDGKAADPNTAATLKSLVEKGWEIAAHSDSHTNLGELEKTDPSLVRADIRTCLDKIERAVGLRPVTLILPYGQMLVDAHLLYEEGITWAVGISGGESYDATDLIYYVGRDSTFGDAQLTFRSMLKRFNP